MAAEEIAAASQQPPTGAAASGVVRGIAWRELFPWLLLVRSFRLAIDPRQLLLAAVGLLLMLSGWWVLAQLFSGTSEAHLSDMVQFYSVWPWSDAGAIPLVDEAVAANAVTPSNADVLGESVVEPPAWRPFNPFWNSWEWISRPMRHVFDSRLTVTGFAFLLLCGLWTVVVWGLFGGAITRMAAVRLAREERTTLGHALAHARSKWGAYVWAPLFPLVGVGLLAVPGALAGWLLRFDVGIVLAAIVWPVFLMLALVMMIFLVGLAVGWPLMWATISVEGTDSFDALSRSYAYVYQRPLHYLFYAAVAAFFGLLGSIVVWAFAFGAVYMSLWTTSWTSGGARMDEIVDSLPTAFAGFQWHEAPADPPAAAQRPPVGTGYVALLAFWLASVKVIAFGFGLSYFWTSSTGIYLLLRSNVDGTELDEMHTSDEEAPYGLPPLEADAAGVPLAADKEPQEVAAAGQLAQPPEHAAHPRVEETPS